MKGGFLSSKESDIRLKIRQVLDQVGIIENENSIAGNLSYGHQRLLEVAMGLASKPKLLILDEPTQGLAESEIQHFCNLIQGLSDSMTILLIEHNMQVVLELAEQITVMDQGKILAEGTPSEIEANSAVQESYLGD